MGVFLGSSVTPAFAVGPGEDGCPSTFTAGCFLDCRSVGQCSAEKSQICVLRGGSGYEYLSPEGGSCGAGEGKEIIGNIFIPGSINQLNGMGTRIGVLNWFNSLLILFFSLCVVWFMVQLVLAGAKIITNPGEAKGMEELKEAVTYPIIGMILLASSFLIVTLIGIFFFDNPTFITNPVLPRAQDFVETTE